MGLEEQQRSKSSADIYNRYKKLYNEKKDSGKWNPEKDSNKIIREMMKEFSKTDKCTLSYDSSGFLSRFNYILNFANLSKDFEDADNKLFYLMYFITYVHICYGYYEAFVAHMTDGNFRDTYHKSLDIAVSYAKRLKKDVEDMVLEYINDFNKFIEIKKQLRENYERGKASFLGGTKIGSKYNCIKLDKRAKDRNDATRFVNQLMKELKDGTIKIKLACDDLSYYERIMKDNLDTMLIDEGKSKITVLGSGAYGTALNMCIDEPDCKKNYAVKYAIFQEYYKDEHRDSICSSNNVEVLVLRLLNESIVYTGISPHIVLFLENALCRNINLVETDFRDEVEDGAVMITAMETCIGNLGDMYANKKFTETEFKDSDGKNFSNDEVMMVMIFQIIYTLASIQYFFPYFRHNDLHPENVFIQRSDPSKKFYYYVIDGNAYKIPNTGFSARIADFGMSNITGVIDNILFNDKQFCSEYGFRNNKNHYFDMHRILYPLNKLLEFYGTSPEIIKLVKKVIPKKYDHHPLKEDIEYTTPAKCLKSHFSQFKVKDVPKKTDDISIFGIENEIKKKQKK